MIAGTWTGGIHGEHKDVVKTKVTVDAMVSMAADGKLGDIMQTVNGVKLEDDGT